MRVVIPAGTRVLVDLDGRQLRGRVVQCRTERDGWLVREWHDVALVEPHRGRRWISAAQWQLRTDEGASSVADSST